MMDEIEALKARLKIKQTYKTLFETPEGQIVLHDLLRECGMLSTSMDVDSHQTAYREGKRAIGLFLLTRLRLDNVPAMLNLSEARHDNRDARDSGNPGNPDDAAPILS